MFKIDGEYGVVHIDGNNLNIDKIPLEELDEYIEKLENKQTKLINEQNSYLSQILS